jgi:hypothetical protein
MLSPAAVASVFDLVSLPLFTALELRTAPVDYRHGWLAWWRWRCSSCRRSSISRQRPPMRSAKGSPSLWCGLDVREVKGEERYSLVLSLSGRRMTRALAAGAVAVVFALAGLRAATG